MKRLEISESDLEKIIEVEKKIKDKRISRKLKVLMLRYEGKTNATIAETVGLSVYRIPQLVKEYQRDGLEKYASLKFGGNHRNMSYEEESEILERFRKQAEAGQVVIAQDIKKVFDEKLGRDTGRGYIYMLLERHQWRKVMPRSRHPKKASEEAIEASKK